MKPHFLQRISLARKAEQEEYDRILKEAEAHDLAVVQAERSKWGHDYELDVTLASQAQVAPPMDAGLSNASGCAAIDARRGVLTERRPGAEGLARHAADAAALVLAGSCAQALPELFDDKASIKAARALLGTRDVPPLTSEAVLYGLNQNHFAQSVKAYLECYPYATVMLVGCGLSTLFYRADNRRANWVMVDRAETLQVRNRLGLDRHAHIEQLACEPRSLEWLRGTDKVNSAAKNGKKGFIAVVEDELFRWTPPEVKDMVQSMAAKRPGAQLTFNCVGSRAAKGLDGFRLFDMNAQSAFRAWLPERRIRIYESVGIPKGVANELERNVKRKAKSMADHGWRMCMDIKF